MDKTESLAISGHITTLVLSSLTSTELASNQSSHLTFIIIKPALIKPGTAELSPSTTTTEVKDSIGRMSSPGKLKENDVNHSSSMTYMIVFLVMLPGVSAFLMGSTYMEGKLNPTPSRSRSYGMGVKLSLKKAMAMTENLAQGDQNNGD